VTYSTLIRNLVARSLISTALVAAGLISATTYAAAPGITGGASTAATVTFNIAASPGFISMPDGAQVYSWGYGCGVAPAAITSPLPSPLPAIGAPPAAPGTGQGPGFVPATITTATCGLMQIPGPTMAVTEGQIVTVNLYNGLPAVAGNTSIVFSNLPTTATVTGSTTPPVKGLTAAEAPPGTTITYTFVASSPGTYAYYSGSRAELQVEMGLYGAIIVLPKAPVSGAACAASNPSLRGLSGNTVGGTDFRLATSAFDHPESCYDREFLFQFAEMDGNIHNAVQACVNAGAGCTELNVVTDPYHPNYFLINGRAFPDDADPNYVPMYPNQPYNGDPQIHPGESMLLRVIGQGREQHPFHIHANHGRVLARDGSMLLAANDPLAATNGYSRLAGPLYYTVPTVPGQAQDLIFTFTGKGLNWDMYGHGIANGIRVAQGNPPFPIGPTPPNNPLGDPNPCYPDTNGFYTINSSVISGQTAAPASAPNYYEWCADHNKPIPITPPDPQIIANGLWYGGTPYLGLTTVPVGGGAPQFLSTPLPPGTTIQNPTAGYAFMWHSHAERELTTNNIFPGGMMMFLIVQPPVAPIDETN
jgi:hypothetical protein